MNVKNQPPAPSPGESDEQECVRQVLTDLACVLGLLIENPAPTLTSEAEELLKETSQGLRGENSLEFFFNLLEQGRGLGPALSSGGITQAGNVVLKKVLALHFAPPGVSGPPPMVAGRNTLADRMLSGGA